MKTVYFIFLCLALPSLSCKGQLSLQTRGGESNFHPLCFYNGVLHSSDSSFNYTNVAFSFLEGGSSWVEVYYGSNANDTSFIREWFGPDREKGIVFLFTKQDISPLNKKQLKREYLAKDVLIKINSEPLATKESFNNELDIEKLKPYFVTKNFRLKKWDTGEEKTFVLLVVTRAL